MRKHTLAGIILTAIGLLNLTIAQAQSLQINPTISEKDCYHLWIKACRDDLKSNSACLAGDSAYIAEHITLLNNYPPTNGMDAISFLIHIDEQIIGFANDYLKKPYDVRRKLLYSNLRPRDIDLIKSGIDPVLENQCEREVDVLQWQSEIAILQRMKNH
jgi:hypothetical protein